MKISHPAPYTLPTFTVPARRTAANRGFWARRPTYQKVCLGVAAGIAGLTATGCILFAPLLPKLADLINLSKAGGAPGAPPPPPAPPTGFDPFNATFVGENATDLDTLGWITTDRHTNGGAFFCTFEHDALQAAASGLQMTVRPAPVKWGYACGETKSNLTYIYGRFSADLQAATHHGLVTSAFVYGESTPGLAQEIDIEITGGHTSTLSATAWRDGKKQQVLVPLGFDAAQRVHNYAFEWRNDSVAWFVDGAQVLAMHENLPRPVAARFMVNTWLSVPSLWAGLYIPLVKRPVSRSTYQSIAYAP